ncbi:glutamate-1-semialdehyde 2,1-aminomutase, chloroplastic-like [Telopea speciosissima]|uniref:glutamate-1-semialdehyde 2,1-aminomutase, chloroplastic-like n=1 Tax=Telopea speciosissima TaxID=54955 RepID=UPI001CC56943|nr:glutamate-1-semialdehyde 2,1-aminomutase, chloroplastic-like [Telopea speciosissima]XP_043707016.1 glutamate-1-semialdehyde 2,1-aminomutase, chloroplastic-like [Telopea speciosissima]
MASTSWVGLSWLSNLSPGPSSSPCPSNSSPRRISSQINMAVSVEKKKFTLQKSEEIFNAAKDLMPGGVNSPVRAFKSVGGQPIVIDSVKGSHMWDVDGNEYIDYVGSWGPAIIGHADDKVLAALAETMMKGTSFGAPCVLENVLAELVISAVPSIEMVRFVNSGTEACMGVLRLARAFTSRPKVIKFEGCYHGHADPFLVKAGSGVATLGLPDSPGVPRAATIDTLTSPFNDISTVENLFETHTGEIAAVILEPVVGNSGFIEPKPGFLNALRQITKENGALLIFDEVMTGFRLAYGGAQEYFGITPDLTTLGKIIGGGLPVGAYGGRREIMEMVAPAGPMYQAGTLSGNPLAMTAGIQTLKRLTEPGSYQYLDKITGELIQGILDAGKRAGHQMCGSYISGMFGFFFTEGPVYSFGDAKKSDTTKFARFFRGMLEEGVYLAPSQYEAGFTSLAHTKEDIQNTIEAAERVFQQL